MLNKAFPRTWKFPLHYLHVSQSYWMCVHLRVNKIFCSSSSSSFCLLHNSGYFHLYYFRSSRYIFTILLFYEMWNVYQSVCDSRWSRRCCVMPLCVICFVSNWQTLRLSFNKQTIFIQPTLPRLGSSAHFFDWVLTSSDAE